MPELKVPPVPQDLYYDLRDRRLLPLVALILVAIVAVPVPARRGVGRSRADPETASPDRRRASARAPRADRGAGRTPGLRDYRKRLARPRPHRPLSSATPVYPSRSQLGTRRPTAATRRATVDRSTLTGPDGRVRAEDPGPGRRRRARQSAPATRSGPRRWRWRMVGGARICTFSAFAIDVKIAKSGAARTPGKQEPVIKKEVLPLTPLPGDKDAGRHLHGQPRRRATPC